MTESQSKTQPRSLAANEIDPWGAYLQRAAAGEKAAFTQFVREANRPLWRFVRMLVNDDQLTEDIISDLNIKLWNKCGAFDPSKGSGRTWVYRVTRNLVRDILKRENNYEKSKSFSFEAMLDRVRADDNGSGFEPEDDDEPTPAEQAIQAEQKRDLHSALQQLPEKDRIVIWLRKIEEWSTADVAAMLNMTKIAVDTRASRAVDKLKVIMSDKL